MSRHSTQTQACDPYQARQRLTDAEQFLEAAQILDAPDVVATNAIHAAIAASDAITCLVLNQRSVGANHLGAVSLLEEVDALLASKLRRALTKKTQAGYDSNDVSATDATNCLKWATQLVEAARARLGN